LRVTRSPGYLLVVIGGFLMFIDTLLAWQSITVGGLTFSRNAWHGLFGFLLGLLSIAFLINAVSYAGILEVGLKLPHKLLAIVLAPAILALSLIKNIDDSHSGWASYVGIILGALITWGAWLLYNERPAEARTRTLPPPPLGPPPAPPSAGPPP
jgi:hypothetical protein